jgi:phytanoyl-CoA hydroxylase
VKRALAAVRKGAALNPDRVPVAVSKALANEPASLRKGVAFDPYRDPVEIPRFRSSFGGLWTDLSNAVELVAGKRALGKITPDDAQALLDFIENGYVLLRGAVEPERIDRLNADVNALAADPPPEAWVNCIEDGHSVTRQMQRSDTDSADKMLKLLDLYAFLPSARAVVFAPRTLHFLHLIFERPALVHQSLFFFKGSQQPMHRDTAFVRVSSPMEFCGSWTALEDVVPGSGELMYYPGSQNFAEFKFEGNYKWCPPGSPDLARFYKDLEASAKKARVKKQIFRIAKGDVVIWNADLAHGGSEIDDVRKTRQSIVAHYSPANTYPMYRHYEGATNVETYQPGALYCQAKKVYWRSG